MLVRQTNYSEYLRSRGLIPSTFSQYQTVHLSLYLAQILFDVAIGVMARWLKSKA